MKYESSSDESNGGKYGMKFSVLLNQYYMPDSGFEVTDLYKQTELMERLGFGGAALGERHPHEGGIR